MNLNKHIENRDTLKGLANALKMSERTLKKRIANNSWKVHEILIISMYLNVDIRTLLEEA